MKVRILIFLFILYFSLTLVGCSFKEPIRTPIPTLTSTFNPINFSSPTSPVVTPTQEDLSNVISDFALSPDGQKILVCTEKDIYIYDVHTLERTQFFVVGGSYGCGKIAFSPDGTKIAIASTFTDNTVSVVDVNTGKTVWRTSDIPNGNSVTEMEFSPQGAALFVRSQYLESPARCEFSEDSLELYSLERTSNVLFEDRLLQVRWCRYTPGRIEFLSDGRFYLFLDDFGSSPYQVFVGNSSTGQIIERNEYDLGKEGWFYDVSLDGKIYAIAESMAAHSKTSIVDASSAKSLMTVPYFVKLLRDQTQFLVRDDDYSWKLWKNGEVTCSYDFNVSNFKLSADVNYLVVPSSDNSVDIWKVSNCQKINTITLSE